MVRSQSCGFGLTALVCILQGQQLTPLVTAPLPSPLSSPSISLFAYLSSLIHHLGQVHAFIRKPLDLSSTHDTQAWYAEFRVHDERLLGWWMCLPEKVRHAAPFSCLSRKIHH